MLDGELDLASIPAFERAVTEGAARASETVILDMRGLEFIDSSGLYAVIKADERTRAGGRRLVIVRGQHAVRYVFELAMLEGHFEFVDAPEYA